MKPIPKAAVDLVKKFEGRMLKAYPDPATGGDPWTCGYGATGPDVVKGTQWTIWQAEDRLMSDLAKFAKAVDQMVTVELTSNQRASLICFAFNVGEGNLKSSTLLRLLNDGKYDKAAAEFTRWNKAAGKVMAGLTARRCAEQALFLKKD